MSESNEGIKDGKRRLPSDQDDRSSHSEKKRRKKEGRTSSGTKGRPKYCPLSERQQLALLMQMTAEENNEQASTPSPSVKKASGSSGRKDKVNKRNERGETPLHLATIRGELPSIMNLIKQGADINVQDYAGWTPLHEACNHGYQDIAKFLLEAGATVNSKGLDNDYPLHDAVMNEHVDLVELLLKHGANPLLPNKNGERPLDMTENEEIRRMMQNEIISSDESEHTDSSSMIENRLEQNKNRIVKEISTEKRLDSQSDQPEGMRKSSNPTASRELFRQMEPKIYSKKSSSSSDSDDSDDLPLSRQKNALSFSSKLGNSNVKVTVVTTSPKSTTTPTFSGRKLKNASKQKRLLSNESSDSTDSDVKPHRYNSHSDAKFRKQSASSDDEISLSQSLLVQKNEQRSLSVDLNSSEKFPVPATIAKSEEPDVYDFSQDADDFLTANDGISLKPESRVFPKWEISATPKTAPPKNSSSVCRKSSISFSAAKGLDSKKSRKTSGDGTKIVETPTEKPERDKKTVLIKPVVQPTYETSEMMFDRIFKSTETLKANGTDAMFIDKTDKEKSETFAPALKQTVPSIPVTTVVSVVTTAPISLISKPSTPIGSFLSTSTTVKSDKKMIFTPSFPFTGKSFVVGSEVTLTKPQQFFTKTSTSSRSLFPVNLKPVVSISNVSTSTTLLSKPATNSLEHTPKSKLPQAGMGNQVTEVKPVTIVKSENKMTLPERSMSVDSKVENSHQQQHRPSLETTEVAENKNLKKVLKTEGTKEKLCKTLSEPLKRAAEKPGVKEIKTNSIDLKKTAPTTPKQVISTVNKKEVKSEQKKVSLAPASESNFILDIESSTRQRNREKQQKLRRKKMLQQKKTKPTVLAKAEDKKDVKKCESKPTESQSSVDTANESKLFQPQKTSQIQKNEAQKTLDSSLGPCVLKTSQADELPLATAKYFAPSRPDMITSISNDSAVFEKLQGVASFCQRRQVSLPDMKTSDGAPVTSTNILTSSSSHGSFVQFLSQPSSFTDKTVPPVLDISANIPSSITPSVVKASAETFEATPVISNQSLPGTNSNSSRQTSCAAQTISVLSVTSDCNISSSFSEHNPASSPSPGLVTQNSCATSQSISIKSLNQLPVEGSAAVRTSITPISPSTTAVTTEVHTIVTSSSSLISAPPPLATTTTTTTSAVKPTDCLTGSDHGMTSCDKPIFNSTRDEEVSVSKGEDRAEDKQLPSQQITDQDAETEVGKKIECPEVQKSSEKILTDDERMLQEYIQKKLSLANILIESKSKQKLPVYIPMTKLLERKKDPAVDKLNVYEERAAIQKQMYEKRKKIATVIPGAPEYYWEYMSFTGGYLLNGSKESHLSVPVLAPPPSLCEPMMGLFNAHEEQRVRLRVQHAIQRQKLIISCEQEVMRVHSRAARTRQNQQIPFSACAVLMDNEVYNLPCTSNEGDVVKTSIRDRLNLRTFTSWVQDVGDKYRKMKDALLARQKHEAEAMFAVQKTEWLMKRRELEHSQKAEDVNEVYVPMVNISDDFKLLPN